ncbi:ParB N-terminal domain-containing protein [Mesorhizobium sp. M1423]|uniref:ParB N-terminal domain-containing protein n=1 Tax=Mesorhizobium sp. M1423 TaxID=2957101 RepID=UPI00333A1980
MPNARQTYPTSCRPCARGVLVPLLVRPNGTPDTFEIVAGRRRYFAQKLSPTSAAKPIPCHAPSWKTATMPTCSKPR